MNEKMKIALARAAERIKNLSSAEFILNIEKHRDGIVASAIIENECFAGEDLSSMFSMQVYVGGGESIDISDLIYEGTTVDMDPANDPVYMLAA